MGRLCNEVVDADIKMVRPLAQIVLNLAEDRDGIRHASDTRQTKLYQRHGRIGH